MSKILDILQSECVHYDVDIINPDDEPTSLCRMQNSRYDICQCKKQAVAIEKDLLLLMQSKDELYKNWLKGEPEPPKYNVEKLPIHIHIIENGSNYEVPHTADLQPGMHYAICPIYNVFNPPDKRFRNRDDFVADLIREIRYVLHNKVNELQVPAGLIRGVIPSFSAQSVLRSIRDELYDAGINYIKPHENYTVLFGASIVSKRKTVEPMVMVASPSSVWINPNFIELLNGRE